jgi:hypothetical protein
MNKGLDASLPNFVIVKDLITVEPILRRTNSPSILAHSPSYRRQFVDRRLRVGLHDGPD